MQKEAKGGKIKHLKKFCFGGAEEDEKGRKGEKVGSQEHKSA